ncbi:hypothetical protein, partial [Butyricicoccus faecihominis]|uniref:hypothetical protein n=1 Tax=Butyricicoccus faecihominis TaxID=1712515 RepID=UPI001A9B9CDD
PNQPQSEVSSATTAVTASLKSFTLSMVLPTFLRDNAIIFVLYAAPVLDVDVAGMHNVVLSGRLPYRKCKNSSYFCRLVKDLV